jgi:hypothetical protein
MIKDCMCVCVCVCVRACVRARVCVYKYILDCICMYRDKKRAYYAFKYGFMYYTCKGIYKVRLKIGRRHKM